LTQTDAAMPAAARADAAVADPVDDVRREDRAARRRAGAFLKARVRDARVPLALCIGAGLVDGLLLIGQAALLAVVLHAAIIEGAPRAELWAPLIGLLALYLGRAGSAWLTEVAGFAAGARVREDLRNAVQAKLARLGPAFLADRSSGAVAATAVEQVEAVEGFFARYLPQMVLAGLVPLAILMVVFPVNWVVGTLFLLTAPLVPMFMAIVGMGAAAASRRQFRVLERMSGHFLDRLQGLTTLKLFNMARAELDEIRAVSDDFRRRTMSVLKLAFLSSAVLEFFSSVAIAMVAIYVGLSLLGQFSFGTGPDGLSLYVGLFVLLLAPDFFLPLRRMAQSYHDRAAAVAAAQGLMEILDAPEPEAPAAPTPLPRRDRADLVFDRVSIAFDGGRRGALDDLSFTLEPGERVALAGPSGSGKSTAIRLALGFHRPDAGRIRLNGVDLAEADLADWRRAIAWIGQSPHLFHGTLADNIRLGRRDADPTAVARAAALARVADFADELPAGLDTPVGERGYGLSGGQAQRVALARAFLKDAPLLLLDEPTANLDGENEALILDAIGRLAEGRTVLLATHSRAGITGMDRVLTQEAGRRVDPADGEAAR
jgi:ATP-binding cassette subfamily C protein CydD